MSKTILRTIRKLHSLAKPESSAFGRNWKMFPNKEYASKLICNALVSDQPTMIARLGATELACMVNYLGVKYPNKHKNIRKYTSNQAPSWWWNRSIIDQMQNWSGFFPANIEKIEQFCELMISDLSKVDILGSWLKEENFFAQELQGTKKVVLEDLEPFFSIYPWTWALEGRKVLVVHPFAATIQSQYRRRTALFDNNLLPEFELDVIPAIQSIAGQKTPFQDWFAALDSMKEEIERREFDVCILGCGAYGFPLAAHVKNLGKKAIHLGGVTQLLFGIKGARWENFIVYPYANLFNEAWVRPSVNETPQKSSLVEGACYW